MSSIIVGPTGELAPGMTATITVFIDHGIYYILIHGIIYVYFRVLSASCGHEPYILI